MTHFTDLSDYVYHRAEDYSPVTKNVGWLGRGHEFPRAQPTEEVLDVLFEFCRVSVAQTRGIHECDLCMPPRTVYAARKHSAKLLLGTAEIRVFSKEGLIYAAPTLVYHYVRTHHYKPPEEFIRALKEGPKPPSQGYFAELNKRKLNWNETSAPAPQQRFRCETINGEVRRVEVQELIHVDEN